MAEHARGMDFFVKRNFLTCWALLLPTLSLGLTLLIFLPTLKVLVKMPRDIPNVWFALTPHSGVPHVESDFSDSNSIRIPFRLAFMRMKELSAEKHHSQNNIARLRSILTGFKKREVAPRIRFVFILIPRTCAPPVGYWSGR